MCIRSNSHRCSIHPLRSLLAITLSHTSSHKVVLANLFLAIQLTKRLLRRSVDFSLHWFYFFIRILGDKSIFMSGKISVKESNTCKRQRSWYHNHREKINIMITLISFVPDNSFHIKEFLECMRVSQLDAIIRP